MMALKNMYCVASLVPRPHRRAFFVWGREKNKILSMAQQVFISGRLSSLLATNPRVHNKPPELLFILIPHLVLKSQRGAKADIAETPFYSTSVRAGR